MLGVKKSSPYRKWLMTLINSIDFEIGLSKENQVLIVIKLNTEEKFIKFSNWIKQNLKNGVLEKTETEIVRKAVHIGKGID